MLLVSCFKCAIELDSQINYMETILNESIFSLGQNMVLPSLISCLNIFYPWTLKISTVISGLGSSKSKMLMSQNALLWGIFCA